MGRALGHEVLPSLSSLCSGTAVRSGIPQSGSWYRHTRPLTESRGRTDLDGPRLSAPHPSIPSKFAGHCTVYEEYEHGSTFVPVRSYVQAHSQSARCSFVVWIFISSWPRAREDGTSCSLAVCIHSNKALSSSVVFCLFFSPLFCDDTHTHTTVVGSSPWLPLLR